MFYLAVRDIALEAVLLGVMMLKLSIKLLLTEKVEDPFPRLNMALALSIIEEPSSSRSFWRKEKTLTVS